MTQFMDKVLEAAIRIGLLAVLVAWCFQIVRPFIVPIVWGVIIAVATYPGYQRLLGFLGERRKLAATLFTLFALLAVIVPAAILAGTLVDSAKSLAADLGDGTVTIPPPPESVARWPIVGEETQRFWSLASENIQAALEQIAPQIKMVARWLLATAAGAGFGILQFVIAIIIAGVLLAHASGGHDAADAIATRLAGERGKGLADLAETTVRSVARGILGVALIQSLLAGLGFLVAGVPAAGLLALLCLLLGVTQIGIAVILIPVVIYLFNTADTFTAVAFLIWSIPVGLLDNVLKPILLGRGVKTPMVIIFIGAIGGFLSSGIIGLFIGAVLLALGYELFLVWLNARPQADGSEGTNTETG
jgi:predicted PurR-regulated permease PerM